MTIGQGIVTLQIVLESKICRNWHETRWFAAVTSICQLTSNSVRRVSGKHHRSPFQTGVSARPEEPLGLGNWVQNRWVELNTS